MEIMAIEIEKIPAWAISAIIYSDYTGLNEEDIELLERWLGTNDYDDIYPPREEDEPYFSSHPAFGLACDVYDCKCIVYV